MWHIHTIENYSVLKRNEILMNPVTQMNLEDVLNEIARHRRINIVLLYLHKILRVVKFIDRK